MAVDSPADRDDFQREVDEALRHKRTFANLLALVTPLVALALSVLGYVVITGSRGTSPWTRNFGADWADWAHGWASAAEVNATVVGLLTAALTLYVATALQSIGPDISPSGAASRILLDDITLLTCVAGAVIAWVLAAGAGWHVDTALAWGPAVATALLLSALAASTESRALTRRQDHYALLRARRHLQDAVGSAPKLSWPRAFPWLRAVGLAVVATTPAAIGLSITFSAPSTVAVLTLLVAVVWFVLIATLWDSVARIRSYQVRYDQRISSEMTITGGCDAALLALLILATWSGTNAWGVTSLVAALLAGLAPVRFPMAEQLRERQLHRRLAQVERELDRASARLAALPEPPTPPTGGVPAWLPDDHLDWVIQVGRLRILRFKARPGSG